MSGIKRHIAVDSQRLPLAVQITMAHVGDREGALPMFLLNDDTLSNADNVTADGGRTGKPFTAHVNSILGVTVEVTKRGELHKFAVIPRCWVVERSFA